MKITWGESSSSDELTADSGSGFEGTSTRDCRSFRRSAENQSQSNLGLFQQYQREADIRQSDESAKCSTTTSAPMRIELRGMPHRSSMPMSRTSHLPYGICRGLLVDNDSGPGCSGGPPRYRKAGIARAQSRCAFGDAAPRSLLSSVAIRLSR